MKSSFVNSLDLRNLDGLTGLAGLADRTGVDIRPVLLRILTDLYIQKASHTPEEDRHYVELASRLIDVVDNATNSLVATKLKHYGAAPAAVMMRLGRILGDGSDVESPPAVAATGHWLEDDLDIFEPAEGLEKKSTGVTQAATAPHPEDYVSRRDIFFASGSRERRDILMTLDRGEAKTSAPLAQGTNVVRYLEQSALAGRFQEFTTLLQQSLGTSRASTTRIVADERGEPFVVAAKALAMPSDMVQRILIFINPSIGHSVDRVYELSDLYAELSIAAAQQMAAIWRAADRLEASRAIHQPYHWPDRPGTQSRDLALPSKRSSSTPDSAIRKQQER